MKQCGIKYMKKSKFKTKLEWLYKASRTLTQYKKMPWMASKKATAYCRIISQKSSIFCPAKYKKPGNNFLASADIK